MKKLIENVVLTASVIIGIYIIGHLGNPESYSHWTVNEEKIGDTIAVWIKMICTVEGNIWMKKIVGIVVLAASAIIGGYLICCPGKTIKYTEYTVSEEQTENIIAEREETADLIESLVFGEETLFYDCSDKTFYYSLIEGNANAYNPCVKINGKRNNIKLAFLTNGITPKGIKNNETISFLAYTDEVYCIYYLKCTTLPLMNIECSEEISDNSVSMKMTLFDNSINAAARLVCSKGEIHFRGATARAYPKKGFRFSLNTESIGGNMRPNHISLLSMRQDDDWLLYAAYNDQEKIRNVFSSNLWEYTCATDNAQGINFGMEYKYLELFINGEYWGLYALGYPIDEKQVCIDERSILYKHGLGSERLQFTKDEDIFGYAEAEKEENAQDRSFLMDYYYDLYINADNNKRLHSGIDIDNVVDFYLFINLIQGTDNVDLIKNYYILLQNKKEGAKALYAPWDLDLTWGNQYIGVMEANCTYSYAHSEDFNCIIESGYISQLMINGDSSIWEKIFEKYRTFRESGWSEENINILLDKYEADIFASGAYLRDMERWPDGTYGNAAEGLDIFRDYVMNRLHEADLYYERLENMYYENSNIFIRRSIQYKNLFERSFLIEINDYHLLEDSDYVDFLEYIGVDVSSVTEDVHFILVDPAEKEVEYLPTLYEDEGQKESCIGRLSFTKLREGVYEVKLDGVACYSTTIFSRPDIGMVIVKGTTICAFDFTKGYSVKEQTEYFDKLKCYIEALSDTNYWAVVEINNPAIWQDTDYITLFEKLGISNEDIHMNTDFIVWNGSEKAAVTLDNFHVSGSSSDTQIGSMGVFENEWGEYGFYLNGREAFISSMEKNQYADIRIVLLDPETYERVDMITFSDDLKK